MTLYKNSTNTKIRLPVLRPDFGEDEMAFKPYTLLLVQFRDDSEFLWQERVVLEWRNM